MYTTARWIWNFVRLRFELTEGLRFMAGMGLLGLVLFFLGAVGQGIVFLFGPPILFWGCILIYGFLSHTQFSKTKLRRTLSSAVQGLVWLTGGGLIM